MPGEKQETSYPKCKANLKELKNLEIQEQIKKNKKTGGTMKQKKIQQTDKTRISTGLSTEAIKQAILDNLQFAQARVPELATQNDWYMAVACTIRDRMLDNWTKTIKQLRRKDIRAVCYLSAEFLLGPHLANNIINLGIYKEVSQAVSELGLDLEQLIAQEEEPGLGNGGLGRLAACYMDSLSTSRHTCPWLWDQV